MSPAARRATGPIDLGNTATASLLSRRPTLEGHMRHLLGNAILRYGSSKANVGRLTVGLLILLLPAMARAHAGGADAGLAGAMMHPVSGLDHLLAMISVGVVSAQLGGANVWRIPATFVCAMAAGTALGIAQWPVDRIGSVPSWKSIL